MKRPQLLQKELVDVEVIRNLAGAFEGIASMEVGKIRDKTIASKQFFVELWSIYSQLRIDERERLYSWKQDGVKKIPRNLFVAITSQGGLSGDIDSRVIEAMMRMYDPATTDIIMIGDRGARLIQQRGLEYIQSYPMPGTRQEFGDLVLEPIIDEAMRYQKTMLFYQTYQSLVQQGVDQLEIITAVKALTEDAEPTETISRRDYDFEPSLDEITGYIEAVMLQIVLSQTILESTLSQAASRFSAMAGAKQRAEEMRAKLKLTYNRSKRSISDERTREIVTVLKNNK